METGNTIDVTGVKWEFQVVIYRLNPSAPLLSTMRIERYYEYYDYAKEA